MTTILSAKRIHITGVVQGVGFRPFVYGLATRYGLRGWVCNTSAGVDIEVDGAPEALAQFVADLSTQTPPLAHIDSVEVAEIASNGFTTFEIHQSVANPADFMPISPDITLCDDCRRELFDPADRRYLYPFINCTNCGPRFTIIKDIPYDRPFTTMADFVMCEDCAKEYADPLNRRFHAQPVACPKCGPEVWLTVGGQRLAASSSEALIEVRHLLTEGKIVAIKGLGGFHLACDATNDEAVAELRRRKGRIDKPFALMAPTVKAIEQFCEVSPEERALLEAQVHPIVLLRKKSGTPVSQHVAPGQTTLGVMLPYTPLHEPLVCQRPTTNSQQPATRHDQWQLQRGTHRHRQRRCAGSTRAVQLMPSCCTTVIFTCGVMIRWCASLQARNCPCAVRGATRRIR